MKYSQKDMTDEAKFELQMRRKVWQKVRGSYAQFFTLEHQKRYDTLDEMSLVFQFMTAREFQTIVERIERHEKDAKAQTQMF